MRTTLACLACAALIAAAPAAHAAEPEGAATADGTGHPPPAGDRRLPEHDIKSPGFPSALAGKCTTAQDCAAYCKKQPSGDGCRKERKTAP